MARRSNKWRGDSFLELHGNKITAMSLILLVSFISYAAYEGNASSTPAAANLSTTTLTVTSKDPVSTTTLTIQRQSTQTIYSVVPGQEITTTQTDHTTLQEYFTMTLVETTTETDTEANTTWTTTSLVTVISTTTATNISTIQHTTTVSIGRKH